MIRQCIPAGLVLSLLFLGWAGCGAASATYDEGPTPREPDAQQSSSSGGGGGGGDGGGGAGAPSCNTPVVEDCATPEDENCDGMTTCTGTPLGIRRFGDAGTQVPMDIAVDPQGNLIVTGKFDGVLDFGGASLVCRELEDIFVVKLDPSGNPIWSKAIGGDDEQTVQRIAVDSEGNILLVGYFRGMIDLGGGSLVSAGSRDIFAAKLTPDGGHVWSKNFGGPNTQLGRGIAADEEGNVFLAGTIWESADFGGGPLTSAGWEDMFVAKLDKDGKHIWSRTFGDQETQEAWDLATDSEGNVLVTGYALGTVDFGNGPTVGTGMPDAVIVKLSGNGSTLWSRRFGDNGKQFGQSVAVDPRDNVIMSGEFQGTMDFGDGPVLSAGGHDLFVAKFNPTGELIWYRRVGDASDQASIVVAADGAGAVLLTGSFEGSVDFGDTLLVSAGLTDAFVAKLDPDGNALWSRKMGDGATQAGTGITADLEGNVTVVGKMWGTIDLGDASVTTVGDQTSDVFVARFSP